MKRGEAQSFFCIKRKMRKASLILNYSGGVWVYIVKTTYHVEGKVSHRGELKTVTKVGTFQQSNQTVQRTLIFACTLEWVGLDKQCHKSKYRLETGLLISLGSSMMIPKICCRLASLIEKRAQNLWVNTIFNSCHMVPDQPVSTVDLAPIDQVTMKEMR